jgi:hypothetical protein
MSQGDKESGGSSPGTNHAPSVYEFNRCETPTQTPADALAQQTAMEIWGRIPYGGSVPTVQAYRENHRPLAINGPRGILFNSVPRPTPGTGTPFEARWRLGSPGVSARLGGFAAISLSRFLNLQP